MSDSFQPLLLHPCLIQKSTTTFRLPGAEVEVEIPASLAKKIVRFADGTVTLQTFLKRLDRKWSEHSLKRLIESLREKGVLVDGRDASPVFWELMSNPSAVPHELTEKQVTQLFLEDSIQRSDDSGVHILKVRTSAHPLGARTSTRVFGGGSVKKGALGQILWAAHGLIAETVSVGGSVRHKRTVPSAGALYPTLLHLVLFRRVHSLLPGVYRVTAPRPGSIALTLVTEELGTIASCFVDRRTVRDAAGVLVISGAIDRSTKKYANRGILYTILEAGHVAQNTLRELHECGLAGVEIGGFFERRLQRACKLSSGQMPLTTIVFGTRKQEGLNNVFETEEGIVTHVEFAPRTVARYTIPFEMAFAEVNTDESPWWSCGRAPTKELAELKATAEAVEWNAFGEFDKSALRTATYREVQDLAIHPLELARYLPSQFGAKTGLQPFREDRTVQWQEIADVQTGERRLVLADFVFFPYRALGGNYAFASSSGCACHTSAAQARQNALLELIEREAVAITWLNKGRRARITPRSMSTNLQGRLRALKRVNFDTHVLNFTLDLTPVAFVLVKSAKYSYATCAAASAFTMEEAIDKALMEAEAAVFCRLRDGEPLIRLAPEDVRTPENHAALYEDGQFQRKLDFLLEAPKSISLKDIRGHGHPNSMEGLYAAMQRAGLTAYVARLTPEQGKKEGKRRFHVVRLIVPGMVPLAFGYESIPLALPRIRTLAPLAGGKPKPPSQLNRFPHPFG